MSDNPLENPVVEKQVVEIEVKLPEKAKKPRSEAQKATTAKALEVLKARREAKNNEEKAVKESKELEKEAKRGVKRSVPVNEVVTKKDLDEYMKGIKELIANTKAPTVEKVVEKVVEKPVEKVVERVIEKPAPVKLSGHALLDELFFKNR